MLSAFPLLLLLFLLLLRAARRRRSGGATEPSGSAEATVQMYPNNASAICFVLHLERCCCFGCLRVFHFLCRFSELKKENLTSCRLRLELLIARKRGRESDAARERSISSIFLCKSNRKFRAFQLLSLSYKLESVFGQLCSEFARLERAVQRRLYFKFSLCEVHNK